MGDHFGAKTMLIISYMIVFLITTVVGYGGHMNINSLTFYFILFALNGLMQSTGWPSVVTIFTSWFGKRGRGTLIGIWSTSGNAGNVIGSLLTSVCTSSLGYSWHVTYPIIGFFCLIIAIFNWILLVPHPSERDIIIDEYDERMNETERLLSVSMNTNNN